MNLKSHIAITLSAIFLLAEVTLSIEKVVCIEEDGHFAIEEGVDGQCGRLEKARHECSHDAVESHHHLEAGDSHCGNCEDFSLAKNPALMKNSSECQHTGFFSHTAFIYKAAAFAVQDHRRTAFRYYSA